MIPKFEHDFYLGDGWYGCVEWNMSGGFYEGLLYSTSECSINHLWEQKFSEYFPSEEAMIKWAEATIKVNNT